MKSIELTEEHKSKLLEMCKKLFCNSDICLTGPSGRSWDSKNKFFISIWNNIDGETIIHWFEFCMIHLIKKLNKFETEEELPPYARHSAINEIIIDGKWNVYTRFYYHYPKNQYKKHIVDYLYEEFKKLK